MNKINTLVFLSVLSILLFACVNPKSEQLVCENKSSVLAWISPFDQETFEYGEDIIVKGYSCLPQGGDWAISTATLNVFDENNEILLEAHIVKENMENYFYNSFKNNYSETDTTRLRLFIYGTSTNGKNEISEERTIICLPK